MNPHVASFLRSNLQTWMKENAIPSFRADQIWDWFFQKGVTSFEGMANLSKPLQAQLEEKLSLKRPEISQALTSVDGTRKWLLKFHDGTEAETVFIPTPERGTLCISSQIGCTLSCKFCHTGTQVLVRNLEPHEIVGQLLIAKDVLEEWAGPPHFEATRQVTNIVMMGMGEPLYNYDNVAKALKILMDPKGIGFSRHKITLSTSGVVPFIERCGHELGVNLAISLHAVTNDLRNVLVPLNKKYPIEELLQACRAYPGIERRRITFEYVMLKGVNDSDAEARQLVRLIKGIPARINLIPFNPWPGTVFEVSEPKRIDSFAAIIEKAGYKAPVRESRGPDIFAACGQLKSQSQRARKCAGG